MQRRKIVIAAISLLLVGLALPSANINKAHAFTTGVYSVQIGNVLIGSNLPSGLGGGPIAASGSTITVTTTIQASNVASPAYVRNVTIGYIADWMTAYQNASILPLTTNQIGSEIISIVVPTVSAISPSHTWSVKIWDGPSSGLVGTCSGGDVGNERATGCVVIRSGSLTIVTGDQYAAAQARNTAATTLDNVGALSNSAAQAQLDQANAEIALGDSSWSGGDFSGAKTHYQNAQTDTNNAIATAYNLNGGSQNAGIVSIIESGTGILLFGIGGLLAGFGGLLYLRRKPKA